MSNTPSSSKFTFDTEFRVEGDLVSNAARARQRKVYAQEEIDHMFSKARAEGAKAGMVRAAEAIAAATTALAGALRTALVETHTEVEAIRRDAAMIAFTAARKLAPVAIAALPAGDVEAALREAIHQAIGEPRVVLRASQGVIEAISEKLAEIAHEEGYEGRVVAKVDPGIAGADCRIEWRGGGAERNLSVLEDTIGDLIVRRFSQNSNTSIVKG
jgi:flagellar assembly protein FliH